MLEYVRTDSLVAAPKPTHFPAKYDNARAFLHRWTGLGGSDSPGSGGSRGGSESGGTSVHTTKFVEQEPHHRGYRGYDSGRD